MRFALSFGTVQRSLFLAAAIVAASQPVTLLGQVSPLSLNDYSRLGARQTAATKVNDHIYLALGFSNTFLVLTDEGNVVIDTSSALSARKHHELLRKVSQAPVRYIVLTHGHHDHTGGVSLWKEPQTILVAQRNFLELDRYQTRFSRYLARDRGRPIRFG